MNNTLDILTLQLFLGSIVFIIGSIVLLLLLYRCYKIMFVTKVVVISSQLVLTHILSNWKVR